MTENTSSPDKTGTHEAKKSFKSKERRFQYDDRRYIDRGQLWTLQISPEILTQGVEKLNCGKVGRPYVFSNACFAAASLFKKRHRHKVQAAPGSGRDDSRQGKRAHVLGVPEEDDQAWLHCCRQ